MKRAILKSVVATAVFSALTISLPLAAQDSGTSPSQYSVINLGTLGGSFGNGFGGVNNRNWVTGDSSLAGDQTEHGFLWRDGVMTDLGTLGGPNSSVGLPVKNNTGLIMGTAQINEVDPLGEFWGAGFMCTNVSSCEGWQNLELGFLWKNGVMTALPTLGGNNSAAAGVNNRGQVVGWAENATQDPSCVPPQVLDFEAVIWGPKPNQIRKLPVFPGDSVAAAIAINDNGQIVGTSGICAVPTFALGTHAVLWQHGSVTDLGGFGGVMNNSGIAINNAGQVVGISDLPGDTATHAFFWQNGVMTDIGTLPGDVYSQASDINSKGLVVGISCDVNFNCRAFLWEKGVMTDLNTLIPPGSPLYLTFGGGINDRGEIAGTACVISNGACTSEQPAFLAIPCDNADIGAEGGDTVAQGAQAEQRVDERPRVTISESVREMQRQRLGVRHQASPIRP